MSQIHQSSVTQQFPVGVQAHERQHDENSRGSQGEGRRIVACLTRRCVQAIRVRHR